MKTSLMILCAALAFSSGAFAADTSTLRLGIDPTYPPMDAKAPDGSLKGFDVDLGNEICRRKQIGVQSGTQFEGYALKNWTPLGANVVAYKSQDEVFADLQNGRLDGALLGTVEADYGFLRTPAGKGFAFVGEPLSMGDRGVGIGLRKDETEVQASINAAIASMRKDGTYAQIAKKYFDFDPYGN